MHFFLCRLHLSIHALLRHQPLPRSSGKSVSGHRPGNECESPEWEKGSGATACSDQTQTCRSPDRVLQSSSVEYPHGTSASEIFDSYHFDEVQERVHYNLVARSNLKGTKCNLGTQQETRCSNVTSVTL